MEFTGERLIPKSGMGNLEEHLVYYRAALPHTIDKLVLDIACGSGWGTAMLAEAARLVCGVDVSREAVEYARQNYAGPRRDFCVGDILHIPFPAGLFETVVCIETFEHVEHKDVVRLIAECHRVLCPGGLWVLSTPDGERYPYHPTSGFVGWHYWHYTRRELLGLLSPVFRSVASVDLTKYLVGPGNFVVCRK